ncbi:MAG: hypothetical protein NPIRA06_20860 [Nitrospirales bacterium]|nr:MAG: hypothetical protein NPIRA06_20860 [Nitrospirales bacterium]
MDKENDPEKPWPQYRDLTTTDWLKRPLVRIASWKYSIGSMMGRQFWEGKEMDVMEQGHVD